VHKEGLYGSFLVHAGRRALHIVVKEVVVDTDNVFSNMPAVDMANAELETLVAIEENHREHKHDNVFLSSRGVKLKIQKVNAFLIQEALGKVKYPEVPIVHIEEDDRDEENPNDPVYMQKVQDANALRNTTAINISVAMGTYCQRDWCPDGIDYVDGNVWPELMEYAGIDVPDKRLARYVAWVKYYVLEDHEELNKLMNAIAQYAGFVQEEEVQQAMESFPDSSERGDDQSTPYTD
jgi:hypothetical protein